jgi:hypothetical protein
MFQAVAAILLNCAVFAGVGLGPLAVLVPGAGLSTLLALAPAAGYALVSVTLTCWLLREGTVASAMLPLTAGLLALSLACLVAVRRRLAARLATANRRRLLPGLAGLALCLGLLTAPLAAGNGGWAVFRGNASDSLIYTFLAKYFDEHPRAWAFTHTAEEVEAADPMLGPPRSMLSIRWTSGAMLAYCAKLAGQGPLEFQYAFTLTSFVLLYAALLPFLAAMGLGPLFAALSSLALATGFFGQFVLDIRAFSQINVLPLTVLLAYAVSLPAPRGRGPAASRLGLLGLSFLACFVNYTEIFPMIVGAVAAFVLAKAMTGRLTRREVLVQAGGFACGMAATWPVRFLFGHMLAQIHFTETAPELWAEAYFQWLFHNVPAGIFGLPLAENGFSGLPGLSFLNLPPVLVTAFALAMAVLFVLGALRAATDRDHDAPLAALAFAAASLAAFALFTFKNAPWVAGKGLSYFYPFLLALPLYAALARQPWGALSGRVRLPARLADRLALAGTVVAMAFLAWQLAFAGLRPAYAARDRDYLRYVRNHGRYRVIDCDTTAIRAALAGSPAAPVAVCSPDPWKWAFLGLTLDAERPVRLPSQMLDGPAQDLVFLALDRPAGGVPPELAPYVAAGNATFVLYHLPRGLLASLAGTLACATNPY